MHFLPQAAVFLLTAVLLVPLFQRLKLGSVLGYLGAGMLIGPWGLGMVANVESTLEFAEFGVVLLLFLVGLELQPSRLWVRRPVSGLGALQVSPPARRWPSPRPPWAAVAGRPGRRIRAGDVVDGGAKCSPARRAQAARDPSRARRSRCCCSKISR
jgi:hypothetical protein